jgi:hypothetical protein
MNDISIKEKKWNVIYWNTPIKHKNVFFFLTKLESLSLLWLAWNCLRNSNFNILFFQKLFKWYIWKHEFKAYPIMYFKTFIISDNN